MSKSSVYIFAGVFKSIDQACVYSEPQWEPEPSYDANDEEYQAWEDSNPKHSLKQNVEADLDSGFIETVGLNYEYLSGLKISPDGIKNIQALLKHKENVFVLVFEDALGGFNLESKPITNSVLTYCGNYSCEV
jgi:hypothetical protein